jgi:DNA polymerase-3 subunit alpha
LIGLYVSDHPLNPVMDILSETVTHYSSQLSEASPKERVRVAGVITRFRTHQTKTGKSMAFVTLEDLQVEIELVVFPRTWEQSNELIAIDRIIMAEGRIDAQASQAKVLVDSLTVDLKVTSLAKPVAQPSTLRNGYSAPLYVAEPTGLPGE